jgi:3-hydroxybutyryl-CoA dehydratase
MSQVVERDAFYLGEEAAIERTFTKDDVEQFAYLTNDVNPVHLDPEYAKSTRFGTCIVHGALVASLLSAVLGNQLPGPGAIYISQELKFLAPVYVGEKLKARVEVIDWDQSKGRIRILTEVHNGDGIKVLQGEAKLVMAAYLKAK